MTIIAPCCPAGLSCLFYVFLLCFEQINYDDDDELTQRLYEPAASRRGRRCCPAGVLLPRRSVSPTSSTERCSSVSKSPSILVSSTSSPATSVRDISIAGIPFQFQF